MAVSLQKLLITSVTTEANTSNIRQLATKEAALFVGFLLFGLALLPLLIYYVGQIVFGEYSGLGYGDFFGTLSSKIRSGDWVASLLILSPYLVWQCLRLMVAAWKLAGRG